MIFIISIVASIFHLCAVYGKQVYEGLKELSEYVALFTDR